MKRLIAGELYEDGIYYDKAECLAAYPPNVKQYDFSRLYSKRYNHILENYQLQHAIEEMEMYHCSKAKITRYKNSFRPITEVYTWVVQYNNFNGYWYPARKVINRYYSDSGKEL